MEENKKEDHLRVETRKNRLRRKVFRFTKIIAVFASVSSIICLLILVYNTFLVEPTIKGNFARYKVAGVVSYSGELQNLSSYHARELTVKGRLNSRIIDLAVTTSDSIEKRIINNPIGCVEFLLKRLSARNKCQFDVIVDQNGEIIETFQLSWGKKGGLILIPQRSDDNIRRGIELGEKLSDLSGRARQKWFENNSKNIRK